jgi:carbonic anhydrase/acetyltransferase-like protein (isoleucine patch superfamily)
MNYSTNAVNSGTLFLSQNAFLHANGITTNTFVGFAAGNHGSILSGQGGNTGVGNLALASLSGATNMTALGYGAFSNVTNGFNSIAIGLNAGQNKTGPNYMIAIGDYALANSVSGGDQSVGIGTDALRNSTGIHNTAIGFQAGYNDVEVLTQSNNTFIGRAARYSSPFISNSTAIGYDAIVTQSHMIRLGNAVVGVIEGQVMFTTASDRKFKTNIQNSELGLDFIMRLRPVTYNMREGHEGILYTGLIAQELEQVMDDMGVEFSGLKRPANETDHYGVSYATLTMPLIKAVQEQQAEIEALRAENAELRRQVDYIMSVIEGRD